jgi:hypothetical protein
VPPIPADVWRGQVQAARSQVSHKAGGRGHGTAGELLVPFVNCEFDFGLTAKLSPRPRKTYLTLPPSPPSTLLNMSWIDMNNMNWHEWHEFTWIYMNWHEFTWITLITWICWKNMNLHEITFNDNKWHEWRVTWMTWIDMSGHDILLHKLYECHE